MPLNWIDVSNLSFNSLLLLEQVQLSWFPGWLPEASLGVALQANPVVEWYLRHKCPVLNPWLIGVMAARTDHPIPDPAEVRRAEIAVMASITDLLTYVVDPAAYASQPFLNWDPRELTSIVDFAGQTVVDVGSGTGKLAMIAAPLAKTVYAVEPVASLRSYLRAAAAEKGYRNLYAVDGLITSLPFPAGFAGVTMGGHVFGDQPEAEYQELCRLTRPGGLIILCPGNNDEENDRHTFLVKRGFAWGRFEEPGAGRVRKYWKQV